MPSSVVVADASNDVSPATAKPKVPTPPSVVLRMSNPPGGTMNRFVYVHVTTSPARSVTSVLPVVMVDFVGLPRLLVHPIETSAKSSGTCSAKCQGGVAPLTSDRKKRPPVSAGCPGPAVRLNAPFALNEMLPVKRNACVGASAPSTTFLTMIWPPAGGGVT